MRGVSDAIITRYFERRAKQFILRPDIRRSVEFGVLNLAAPEYPSVASGMEQMDIILCRNVLIYFDLATVTQIATRLIASLAPGGWLFLGASDPAIAELVPCEVVLTGAGIAYRSAITGTSIRAFTPPPDDSWMQGTGLAAVGDVEAPEIEWQPSIAAPPVPAAEVAGHEAAPDDSADPHESCEGAYEQGDYDAAAELARAAIGRREYGNDDLDLATDLARRAAIAVGNARLYQQAQQATRTRDDVLGIVSHDLRNPLNTTRMSSSFMLDLIGPGGVTIPGSAEGAPPISLDRHFTVILRAARRANALIEDLLDVTRIDARHLAVDLVEVVASSLIRKRCSMPAPSPPTVRSSSVMPGTTATSPSWPIGAASRRSSRTSSATRWSSRRRADGSTCRGRWWRVR